MEEVDVVHRAEADHPAREARGGERAGLRDPLHHAATVDLAGRAGMLREHPVDQLDCGLGDRRHIREKTEPPRHGGTARCNTGPSIEAIRVCAE